MIEQSWAEKTLLRRERTFAPREGSAATAVLKTNIQETIRAYLFEMGCSENRLKKVFIQLLGAGKVRVNFPKLEERLELISDGARSDGVWVKEEIEKCIAQARDAMQLTERVAEDATQQIRVTREQSDHPRSEGNFTDERTVFLRERKPQ
jgi:predicted DNA-binding protein